MSWNTLTAATVQAELTPAEAAVINAIQNSTAILPGIVANLMAEMQGNIISCGQLVGPVGTIPDQILNKVIDVCRWRWFCALPKTNLQSDARKKQAEDAEKWLEDLWESVMAGKRKIEIPAVPQTTPQQTITSPAVELPRSRGFGWSRERGI